MPNKIKPCPFCGNINYLEYGEIFGAGVHKFYIFCKNCDSDGPPKGTKREARKSWNRRTDNAE